MSQRPLRPWNGSLMVGRWVCIASCAAVLCICRPSRSGTEAEADSTLPCGDTMKLELKWPSCVSWRRVSSAISSGCACMSASISALNAR